MVTNAIIQARMSSNRLPGKVMMSLNDKTVLGHIITRLQACVNLDTIILATSAEASDNPLEGESKKYGIHCVRGDLDNVLSRFYLASKKYPSDSIIRICADSPLLDHRIIDASVDCFSKDKSDILKVKNVPLGLGCEVFTFSALKDAFENAANVYQTEHVTPYMYEHYGAAVYEYPKDYSKYRLTLDAKEDLQLIQEVYENLYEDNADFSLEDVIKLMDEQPELYEMNRHVEQVRVPLYKK